MRATIKKAYARPTAQVLEVKYHGVLCGSGVIDNFTPVPWGESVTMGDEPFSLFETNKLL